MTLILEVSGMSKLPRRRKGLLKTSYRVRACVGNATMRKSGLLNEHALVNRTETAFQGGPLI
jgi:hypothetical protein